MPPLSVRFPSHAVAASSCMLVGMCRDCPAEAEYPAVNPLSLAISVPPAEAELEALLERETALTGREKKKARKKARKKKQAVCEWAIWQTRPPAHSPAGSMLPLFCFAADTFCPCLRAPPFLLEVALLWGMRMRMLKAWRLLGPPPCLRTFSGPGSVSYAVMLPQCSCCET